MRIFFGGSLPRFRTNKSDYTNIRDSIVDLGHKLTRDWIQEENNKKINRSVHEMYELTERAINTSDAVIIEYSNDISAVGQQLVLALQKSIPTLLLIKDSKDTEDSPLSDYFIGSKDLKHVKKSKYKNSNVKKLISDFIKWVEENKKLVRFNLELERELDEYLKIKAKRNNSSKAVEIRALIVKDMSRNS